VEGREFPDDAAATAEAQRFINEWNVAGTQIQVADTKGNEITRVRRCSSAKACFAK
jgi:hypothetical protein